MSQLPFGADEGAPRPATMPFAGERIGLDRAPSADGERRRPAAAALADRRPGTGARDSLAETASAGDARFREVLESNPNAVVLVDAEGTIVFVNDLACRLLGYARDELVGSGVDSLVPDELRPLHSADRAAYLQEPRTRQMGFGRDLEARRRDGSVVPVEIGLSSFVSDGERFVVVVLADITARKQIEAELRTTTENLQTLVASSPLATMALDLEGRVELWNPAAERLYGWREDEVVGQILPHVPQTELAEVRQILARIGAGATVTGMPLRRRHKDGSIVEIELHAAPRRDGAGRIVGVIEQMADVTSRRQMEEALLQAQKMESIGRLAGGIAHDFNNMLTAISGFAQLLLLDLPEPSEQHDSAAAIKRAADQAASLTHQLLAFSRRQVLEPQVLDPNAAVSGLQPMLRRLIGENIKLRVVLSPAELRLRADPAQLEQVILNLAVNARDAMPEGGLLTIETGEATFDQAYASEHFEVEAGRYAMIAVSDTGLGMDRATKAHVFEPFFTTKERGKGTGLGLATIYGVVRQSGGHIWLYSEPGEGTTFKIYFPLVEGPAHAAAEAEPRVEAGSGTILLVEDEDAVRGLARIVLERQGYRVLLASGAAEALEILRALPERIDLLITDVVMPGRSGPELAREVRALRPGIRTLFLSGYTEEMAGRNGQLEGGDGFLSKPFTPDTLARVVRDVIRQRHPSSA